MSSESDRSSTWVAGAHVHSARVCVGRPSRLLAQPLSPICLDHSAPAITPVPLASFDDARPSYGPQQAHHPERGGKSLPTSPTSPSPLPAPGMPNPGCSNGLRRPKDASARLLGDGGLSPTRLSSLNLPSDQPRSCVEVRCFVWFAPQNGASPFLLIASRAVTCSQDGQAQRLTRARFGRSSRLPISPAHVGHISSLTSCSRCCFFASSRLFWRLCLDTPETVIRDHYLLTSVKSLDMEAHWGWPAGFSSKGKQSCLSQFPRRYRSTA